MKTIHPKIRLRKFAQSLKENVPVVFCVKCGSTHLDQNSINELRCYECGNKLKWDASRFSIARNHDVRDVINAINREV